MAAHYRACHLCEAICGLEITTEDGRIATVRGDKADVLSRGHICPKGVALKDLHEDPDRLRHPVKRHGRDFVEITWDEAFETVGERLAAIGRDHGGDAVAAYFGNPSVHSVGMLANIGQVVRQLKTRSVFSATSVDQLPHQLMALWMFGHQNYLFVPDIDRTDLMLVFGANPMASNGSIMTVPDFPGRLAALKARGGRMVVVDPRRTETARVASEHHFIRPGSDALVLLAMVQVLLAEGLARPGALADLLAGLDRLAAVLAPFTPERAAAVSGLPAETIRALARALAAAPRAAVYGRMGTSTQAFGTLCQWAIQLLNILTGNFDREGGTLLPHPALPAGFAPRAAGGFDRWRSRVRHLPEFAANFPVSTLADEIETAGPGQIRALLTIAGNPVSSTPNGRRLDAALAGLDFMAAVDFYVNETTRHAHVILPPCSPLERGHYDLALLPLAVRNVTRWSDPLFDKPADARHDWEIFAGIAAAHAKASGGTPVNILPPELMIDLGLQAGPYPGLSLDALRAAPHGIDLGPLRPSIRERLLTASGRIELLPPGCLADLPRLAALAPAGDGLLLIGRRHVRSNNSWMHNSGRLVKGPVRHRLQMHPADMERRQIRDGAAVTVQSRTAALRVEVEATEDVMPGVVCLPHGWGQATRDGVRLAVANAAGGISFNDLSDELALDAASGNAVLNGLPVEVRPCP
ncbi:molybdopterin-dependent oxidoreductase [Zavarzinia compransoris]|uniref:Dehydrogenase n=1 Tax=Zavarzinia compransoris TaxID=1264899 RepID=A0A317DVR7_9PROT|nr:molybdopterin-dependent oxidoreductase [Zavarzinia compransoris]PWR18779.1 dehydrogenase [Zavarzinia compransoris]TDP48764.1 anaerobic selenocysteine-containing dehydrogenase [Zavarzinia compransoris]